MTDLKTQLHYIRTSTERLDVAIGGVPDGPQVMLDGRSYHQLPAWFIRKESTILLRRVLKLWWSVRFGKRK